MIRLVPRTMVSAALLAIGICAPRNDPSVPRIGVNPIYPLKQQEKRGSHRGAEKARSARAFN